MLLWNVLSYSTVCELLHKSVTEDTTVQQRNVIAVPRVQNDTKAEDAMVVPMSVLSAPWLLVVTTFIEATLAVPFVGSKDNAMPQLQLSSI